MESLLPVFIKGRIEQSLQKIFGEIGGQTTVDILKFEEKRKRAVVRVPDQFYVKLRTALTLTDSYQGVPCHFHIHSASPVLISLLDTHWK